MPKIMTMEKLEGCWIRVAGGDAWLVEKVTRRPECRFWGQTYDVEGHYYGAGGAQLPAHARNIYPSDVVVVRRPNLCSEDGCSWPAIGRGLCRLHGGGSAC